jgi:hypothetical protein
MRIAIIPRWRGRTRPIDPRTLRFGSAWTAEAPSGFADIFAEEVFRPAGSYLTLLPPPGIVGPRGATMTWRDQYQQEGSAAELFQRDIVPRITSLWAKTSLIAPVYELAKACSTSRVAQVS